MNTYQVGVGSDRMLGRAHLIASLAREQAASRVRQAPQLERDFTADAFPLTGLQRQLRSLARFLAALLG